MIPITAQDRLLSRKLDCLACVSIPMSSHMTFYFNFWLPVKTLVICMTMFVFCLLVFFKYVERVYLCAEILLVPIKTQLRSMHVVSYL